MSYTAFSLLLGVAALVTLAAMIYLMINARSVALLFRKAGLEPGPGRRVASKRAVIIALLAFNLGWIACIAIYWTAWSGAAEEVVEPQPAPVP